MHTALIAALTLSATLVAAGVAMIYTPAGVITAGLLAAGLAVVTMLEVGE